jgi:hypothetical protein
MRVATSEPEPSFNLEQQGGTPVQDTTEIPREGWDKFFSRFTDDHETQFVAVEVMGS